MVIILCLDQVITVKDTEIWGFKMIKQRYNSQQIIITNIIKMNEYKGLKKRE